MTPRRAKRSAIFLLSGFLSGLGAGGRQRAESRKERLRGALELERALAVGTVDLLRGGALCHVEERVWRALR